MDDPEMVERLEGTSTLDGDLKIEVFRSHKPLQAVWTALQEEACCTVFQTYSWISVLLEKVGSALSATPAIVLVSSAGGTPLMLVPLAEQQHGLVRVLEFIDFDISDYNAPIIRREFAAALAIRGFSPIWSQILKHIGTVDTVNLRKMPPTIDGAPNPFTHLNCQDDVSAFNSSLGSGFTDYMKARSGHMSRELRRNRRKLEAMGPVELKVASDEETAAAIMKFMVYHKSARCRATGAPDLFSKPAYLDFYHTLAREGVGRIAHTCALMVGDRMVAGNFGLVLRGRFYGIIQSSDFANFGTYSPGSLLLVEVIRWCCENGISLFDFSVGAELYKKHWADDEEQLYQYRQASSRMGMLVETRRHALASFKSRAHPQLIEALRSLRNKVRNFA
jgi:CelD/BcsL family acetyltransferase involved in cellulose biosynthesis